MCCFVILLLSNEMQISVRRFSAIPHLREHRSDRHITLFPLMYMDRFVCLLESPLLEPCHQFAQRL